MDLTLGIIAAVGLLVAGILGMIAVDSGFLPEAPAMPMTEHPSICKGPYLPVCGVDGKTYSNLCMINEADVEILYKGECVESSVVPENEPETTEPVNETSENTGSVSLDTTPEPKATPTPEPKATPTPEPNESTTPKMAMPTLPQTHMVSIPQGSSSPGCEQTTECFVPSSLEINVGDTVSWTNDDTAAHTITSGNSADGPSGVFDSSLFSPGSTFEFTFDKTGTYSYFCMVHPWMVGEIIVKEFKETQAFTEENSGNPTTEPIIESQEATISEVQIPAGSSTPGCEKTNECFVPNPIKANTGQTITWINHDSAAHTVTSGIPGTPDGNFDSGMLMPNQSWESTFENSGEYDYFCMVHPWMTGKVIVS